jgi:sec-independent protein translocase protein TatA
MFGSLGAPELLIIGLIVILLFGVGKLSGLGKDLGSSVKEFRKAVKDEDADPPQQPMPTQAQVMPPTQYLPPAQQQPAPPTQYQQPQQPQYVPPAPPQGDPQNKNIF